MIVQMLVIVLAIATVSAFGWNALLGSHLWLASIGSSITSTLFVWIVGSSHMKGVDVAIVAGISLLVSLVVGMLLRKFTSLPR